MPDWLIFLGFSKLFSVYVTVNLQSNTVRNGLDIWLVDLLGFTLGPRKHASKLNQAMDQRCVS